MLSASRKGTSAAQQDDDKYHKKNSESKTGCFSVFLKVLGVLWFIIFLLRPAEDPDLERNTESRSYDEQKKDKLLRTTEAAPAVVEDDEEDEEPAVVEDKPVVAAVIPKMEEKVEIEKPKVVVPATAKPTAKPTLKPTPKPLSDAELKRKKEAEIEKKKKKFIKKRASGFAKFIPSSEELEFFKQEEIEQEKGRLCPCCGWTGAQFDDIESDQSRPDAVCPICGSRERHRRTCALFASHSSLLKPVDTSHFRLLHFAPHAQVDTILEKYPDVDQMNFDFFIDGDEGSQGRTMHADISNLQLPSSFAHGLITLHVLEYASDLDKAMSEMARVLRKPDGWAVIEVPFMGDNPIKSQECAKMKPGGTKHKKCAGKSGRVWAFAQKDFEKRLRATGWNCQDVMPMIQKAYPSELVTSFKLDMPKNDTQYLCRQIDSSKLEIN